MFRKIAPPSVNAGRTVKGGIKRNRSNQTALFTLAGAAFLASSSSAYAVSNYVPPIVATSNTTLLSSTTSISPGRVGVDRAGNVYYVVNGGTTSTLMEIPASAPAVISSTPLTLVTGLGQYNANSVFVDVQGNLWVTVGNGTATPPAGGTDYLSLVEIPAVNGLPNTAAIPAGGESLNTVDATHCSATITTPCTYQNYKLNSPSSSPINGPQVGDLFVDGSGNVYFVDVYDNTSTGNYNVLAKVNLAAGGTATVLATNLPKSGRSQVAVDGGGNVFYFDATTGVVSQVSGGVLTTVGNTATLTTAQIATATGISADSYGNVYIAGSSQLSEVPFEGTSANFADEFGIVNGLGSTTNNGISYGGSVDPYGNYYYAYNGSGSTNIQDLQINGYNFGNVTVGTLVAGPTLTLYFNQGESISGNYFPTGSPTSNTQSAYLQSFPYSGSKTCGGGGTTYAVGATCTAVVNFQPIHPGMLKGSYTPRDGSSNQETVVNLQGGGLGPQAMFLPGIASSLFSSANMSSTVTTQVPLNGPLGLAVDTFGDIFATDPGNGKVVADCLATTTSTTTGNSFCGGTGYLGAVVDLGASFTKPADIALDGANNLYITDSGANTVTKIQSDNIASAVLISASANFGTSPLSSPKGIAVDGYTNIYIADSGNNRIVQAHQFGAPATDNIVYIPSTATFGGTALSNPTGLALDAGGDLFIADTGNNRIVEYTQNGVASVVSTTGITLLAPTAVKVLPSGTLIVTDSANNVSLITNGNGSALPVGTLTPHIPQGVALDLAGNIYLSDTAASRVLELAVSAQLRVAFAATSQGSTSSPNTATITNSGNAALTFSAAPSIAAGGSNFSVVASSTCTTAASVAAGTGSCTVITDFTPQATGPLNGAVTVTDNQLNYTLNPATSNQTANFTSPGTQSAVLTGTGNSSSATPAAIPTFTPGGGTYTAVQSVTLSDTTPGASIYYTTNGTAPTAGSTLYTGAIPVGASQTIQAIAVATGYGNSSVGSATYTIHLPPKAPGSVISQTTLYGAITSGGVLDGGNPAGNSMVVNSLGTVIASTTYGGQIDAFTPAGATVLGSFSNPGPLAIDGGNNLYIGGTYNNQIAKIPFVGGAYAAISTPSGSTPTCTGSDTTECLLPSLSSAVSGLDTMYFDSVGNLFFSSRAGTSANAIFECNVACLTSSSPSATLLYQEPTSSTAQLIIGGLAADQYGDLFFTDSVVVTGNLDSTSSNLKELAAASGGTGFASTPTTLYAYTTASPSGYDNQLDAVAVDNTGTVYFATQNDGLFALLNNQGVVSTGNPYTVSTLGAKLLTTDGKGNFYVAGYNSTTGGDAVSRIATANVAVPTVAVNSTSTSSNITTILTDAACSATPTVAFAATEGGVATTEFTAAAAGTCASTLTGGAAFATTVTFMPTTTGVRTATLTATDSAGGIGSTTVTGTGSALPNAATPAFTPVAGTYTSIQSVTIASTTPSATIYYTTNGSTPTTSSTLYNGPVSVGVSETLSAIAIATNFNVSAVGTAAYVINLPAAPAPTLSLAAGTYTSVQSVTLSDSVTGATIYYTTDGSTPTTSSTVYSAPISVGASETITAVAIGTGYSLSPAASAAFTINLPAATPAFTPAAGTYTSIQSVSISDATAGSKVYYTLDGSTPTTSSTLYSGAITVGTSETIKAVAIATGSSVSAAGSAAYIINLPVAATPVILPGTGTYTSVQTVTITDSTPFAKIYYTTNGTTPTTSSTLYTTAITVGASQTIEAIAVAAGYSNSVVASSVYTVNLPTAAFTVAVTPGSLQVDNGSSGGLNVVVTSVGTFNSSVALTCGGLPAGVTCTFSPASIIPTSTGSVSALVVAAPAVGAALHPPVNPFRRPVLPGAAAAVALCLLGRKRRDPRLRIALLLMLGLFGASIMTGCATSNNLVPHTITITGTATGGSAQTVNFTLTLQQ